MAKYAPELRAEIEFGIENSSEYKEIQDIETQVRSFLNNDEEWQGAENVIVDKRNEFSEQSNKDIRILEKLEESSILEVQFQYAMWKKNYKEAFENISKIISILSMQALNGYRSCLLYTSPLTGIR